MKCYKILASILLLTITSYAASLDYQELIRNLPPEVTIEQKQDNDQPIGFNQKIDLKAFAGKAFKISCEIKGDNISKPSGSYGGVKFMLHYRGADGFERWPAGCDGKYGTFDWTPADFIVNVPHDIVFSEWIFGLQKCTGKIQFRNFQVSPAEIFPDIWEIPEHYRCEYDSRVMSDITRRGVMSPHTREITEKDLRDLAAWNVNLLRWQFQPYDPVIKHDLTKYAQFIDEEIVCLDKWLPLCRKLGIKVIIDMHCVPGDRLGDRKLADQAMADAIRKQDALQLYYRMHFEPECLKLFIDTWRKLASHFRGNPAVWGYDLCNEPYQNFPVVTDYLQCQYLAAKAIREVDSSTPILIESNNSANPRDFRYLKPLPLKNIIYQVHFYNPMKYTHQGVNVASFTPVVYPGAVDGMDYSKDTLRSQLQPVRDFEKKYGAKIYVGEFSVIRWAPNGEKYLRDLVSLFEEYHWDWTYHAFREWDGWSVEHSSDRNDTTPAAMTTPRAKVLLEAFSRNGK